MGLQHMGGHGDDGQRLAGALAADTTGGAEAVHDRHLHIHQHQIERFRQRPIHPLFTIFGMNHLQRRLLQNLSGDLPVDRIVLHQQDARPADLLRHLGQIQRLPLADVDDLLIPPQQPHHLVEKLGWRHRTNQCRRVIGGVGDFTRNTVTKGAQFQYPALRYRRLKGLGWDAIRQVAENQRRHRMVTGIGLLKMPQRSILSGEGHGMETEPL